MFDVTATSKAVFGDGQDQVSVMPLGENKPFFVTLRALDGASLPAIVAVHAASEGGGCGTTTGKPTIDALAVK